MARLIYGVRPVVEALRAARVETLFVAEGDAGPALRDVFEACKKAGVSAVDRPRAALDELAHGGVHQGVVAVVGEYPYVQVDEILDAAKRAAQVPFVVVLDGVQDPQNLGAIVRTAHVSGAHGIIIPKDRAAPVTAASVKSSAGATEHTRIARVTNVARALEELKAAGLWIAGAVAAEAPPPWAVDLKVPLGLVLGAEGKGVRPLVLRGCDLLIRIPMSGKVASLNVAAAGAMLMYETVRQRSRP